MSNHSNALKLVIHELFQHAQVSNEDEQLFIAMYAFALELGFNSHDRREILSTNWRPGHYYTCKLEHQTCRNVPCKLLYAPMTNNTAVVFGFVNDEEVCKLPIQQKEFLSQEKNESTEEIDLYENIEVFARTMKDGILFRILFFAQQSIGLSPTFGFMTAPSEILVRILEYLPSKNLLTISETNKEIYDLSQLPFLWERLFKKDFSDSEDVATDSKSWKDLYREKYLQRKKRRGMLGNYSMGIVPRTYRYPQIVPRLPYPAGIIGGDNDLFPNLGLHPDVAEAFPNLVRRPPRLGFPHFQNF